MKSVLTRLSVLAVVALLVVGISAVASAAESADVTVTITINTKYDLTITSGSAITGTLEPHTITVLSASTITNPGDAYQTALRVQTNSKSWVVTGKITADTGGFLGNEDDDPTGSYTGKIEVSTNGTDWHELGTDAATNLTAEQTQASGNKTFTVSYRVTTTWLHTPGTSYPMTITYTATSYSV